MARRLFYGLINWEKSHKGYYGYFSQMAGILTKSLIPSMTKVQVDVNYERYLREMDLWLQYRSDYNKSLERIKNVDGNVYWKEKDDSIIARVIPIVISNKSFRDDEIMRNTLFTTGNIESLLESVVVARVLYGVLKQDSNPLEDAKDWIINFSQVEFLEVFGRCFRTSIESYPGNYRVDFEKERVKLIGLISGLGGKGYEILTSLIGVLKGEKAEGLMFELLEACSNEDFEFDISQTYINFGAYLENLRDGKIGPESLYIDKYEMPDVFEFEIGDCFYHSLLNNCEVISKERKDGVLRSIVKTKSGLYEFKK